MAKKQIAALSLDERLQQALVPESEQPYKLPDNWCWTRLGEITTIIGGGTPSSRNIEYYDKGTIPWISPADLSGYNEVYISRGAKNITELGLKKSSARILPKDTVLLSSRAPIGYVAIASVELCTNQGFKSFLPSIIYLSKYLYWYLKGNKDLLNSYSSGTTFLELSGSRAAMIEIPIPPLSEQQRIVKRIESLFAKLDEAKEKAQVALDSFETRKAAILHKAFTGELTAKWRKENGVRMESWEEKTIDEIGNVKGGKRLPKGSCLTDLNTGYQYIKAGDLKRGTVLVERLQYITEDVYKLISNYIVNEGDVYITIVGACIGDVGVVPKEVAGANLTENAAKITNLKCVPNYLSFYLSTDRMQNDIKSKIASATLGKLSLQNIKKIQIRIPSPPEQTEIVCILDSFFAKEQRAKELCAVLDNIELIKKSILARAFRGELGTNDPNDENALELLKTVL